MARLNLYGLSDGEIFLVPVLTREEQKEVQFDKFSFQSVSSPTFFKRKVHSKNYISIYILQYISLKVIPHPI